MKGVLAYLLVGCGLSAVLMRLGGAKVRRGSSLGELGVPCGTGTPKTDS